MFGTFPLNNKKALKKFVLQILKKEGKSVAAINYIFCSDEYLLALNRQHLKHDTYTDIITFELQEVNEPIISDIYISVERVKENAISHAIPFKEEVHRVIFHGALHLAGYKDKSSKQKATMRLRENYCLKQYWSFT